MLRRLRWLVVLTILGLLVPILPVGVALADDAVVDGSCDEAEFDAALAVAQTNGGGTITFDCGGAATITFSSEKEITAPNAVVIDGGGLITLSGNHVTRHFDVASGASLEVRGLTIVDGYAREGISYGGAIYSGGPLTVIDSVFRNNIADASLFDDTGIGGAAGISYGGAISFWASDELVIRRSSFVGNISDASVTLTAGGSGTPGIAYGGALHIQSSSAVTIEDSTFSGNVATARATAGTDSSTLGGIAFGGAISTLGSGLTITNSTISGNVAEAGREVHTGGIAQGGGIFDLGVNTTLSTSTIAFNESRAPESSISQGGGIFHPSAGMTVNQTIIAANLPEDCYSSSTPSSGYSLDSDGSCGLIEPTDISSGDADLGPLAANGGPTMTHLLQPGSDALDNGPLFCLPADQRGEPRPSGPACDIGAVEVQPGPAFVLCADYYTGRVLSPLSGQCGARQFELAVPESYPLAFCIDPYTGVVSYTFGRPCNPPRRSHVVPDDGDLLTCVNRYTGINRWVYNHSQCNANELPNSIPVV